MSNFRDALAQYIADMEKARENAGKRPTAVLLTDVHAAIMQELQLLQQNGVIRIGRTLNNTYITTHGIEQVRPQEHCAD